VRIVAGRMRGRRLMVPKWTGLRPTSDGLRETLFNVIADRVAGSRVLDAFAGTGALGLEALSRGAASAVFVDNDRRATELIANNVARCGVGEACAIIRADASRADRLPAASFDLVLADPPYEGIDTEQTIAALGCVLAEGGLLVLEHARRTAVTPRVGSLVCVRQIVSGDSALALYERRPAADEAAAAAPGTPDER